MSYIVIKCLQCGIVLPQIEVSNNRKPTESDVDKIVDAYLEHEYSQPGYEYHAVQWSPVRELEVRA